MAAARQARKAAIPDRAGVVHRGPHTERQQRRQRSGGYELCHGLVGEADQLVPEGSRQQSRPAGGFPEVASGKHVHARRNRQRDCAEQQLDAADVPEGLTQADGVEQPEEAGHRSRHQPGARTIEKLPVDDAASEDQPVRRLQVLHDLVGVQNEVTRQSHNGARRKCQRQYQRQVLPGAAGLPWMQQDLEHRLNPWKERAPGGPCRSAQAFPWPLSPGHFREALSSCVPACRR